MLGLADWLKRFGFEEGSPFAPKGGEDEQDRLSEYFVEHQAYHAMVDAGPGRSSILHAPRGAGKSSTRRMFEAHCRAHPDRLRPILVSLTDWMPVAERASLSSIGARDLLAEIMRRFLVALSEAQGVAPAADSLPPHAAGHLRWIGHTYAGYLSPEKRDSLEQRGLIRPPTPEDPDRGRYSLVDRPVLDCLGVLATISRSAGFSICYVVIDGVDELCQTTADWSVGADLIAPLLSNIRMLEVPGIAFKCFVPSEIIAVLRARSQLREDRIATFEMTWSLEDLHKLLESRLIVYSNGRYQSLAMLAKPDFADVDSELCRAAQGSPRRLLNLCERLLRACAEDATNDEMLLRRVHLREVLDEAPDAEPADKPIPPLRIAADGIVWIGAKELEQSRRMPPLQRRLLEYLYERRGAPCPVEELLANVWPSHKTPQDMDSLRYLADRLVERIEPNPKAPVYLDRSIQGYVVLRNAAD